MWSSIKQLIRTKNDRCIIVEDGEPKYVIIPFEEYQHLQEKRNDSIVSTSTRSRERDAGKASLGRAEFQEEQEGSEYSSAINIEDLPF